MIPILYEQGETLFQTNGIGRLSDAVSCSVTEERNGAYTLEMVYPLTGRHFSDIQVGRIIWARHSDNINPQPFRIYRISRPMSGLVTVNANHISYDLCDITMLPFTAEGIQATFAAIPYNTAISCPFTFWTDRTTANTYTLDTPMSVRAMLGGVQGSILDVFGGADYEFDKFAVKLHAHRGSDKGVTIRYGKNLSDVNRSTDAEGTYTAIVPFYKDSATGELLLLPEVVLNITGAETYQGTYTNEDGTVYDNGTNQYTAVYSPTKMMALDLTEKWQSMPTVTQLRNAARTYIANNGKVAPVENVKVSFVALWQTEEYKDVAPLQRTEMGDTVKVYYGALGVNVTMRVIKTVYDCLMERYNSIELGTASYTVNQAVKSISTQSAQIASRAAAQQAASAASTVVAEQTALITGQTGGYYVLDTDAAGKPVGWLIMDTPDKDTARYVIRANAAGIGFSANGYDGPYVSAWTIDGKFNADFIQTGALNADLIKVGSISDAQGKFYLDMETGELVMQDGTFTGEVNADTGEIGPLAIGTDDLVYSGEVTSGGETITYSFTISPVGYVVSGNLMGRFLEAQDSKRGVTFAVNYDGSVILKSVTGKRIHLNSEDGVYPVKRVWAENDGITISYNKDVSGVYQYTASITQETNESGGDGLLLTIDSAPITVRTPNHVFRLSDSKVETDLPLTIGGALKGSTAETLSGSYNGLNITLYKNAGAVTCYIRGTTTAAMATASAYVTLFTPADSSWMPTERMISYHQLTGSGYRGQVNPTTTGIELGYTRNASNATADIPASTPIYCMLTWAAK